MAGGCDAGFGLGVGAMGLVVGWSLGSGADATGFSTDPDLDSMSAKTGVAFVGTRLSCGSSATAVSGLWGLNLSMGVFRRADFINDYTKRQMRWAC